MRLRRSLGTEAARQLATTTKSRPQMQEISPRWLLRVLPWVDVRGGTYRVNRRLQVTKSVGRIGVANVGARAVIVTRDLAELAILQGFGDESVLEALAARFEQIELESGEVFASAGEPIDRLLIVAHGKAIRLAAGKYGDEAALGFSTDGDVLGESALSDDPGRWPFSVRAVSHVTALALSASAFAEILARSPALRAHVEAAKNRTSRRVNKFGEAAIEMAAGHSGEPALPSTFVDYELEPREYELSVAQTMLRVHTRVADLYNQPMNQVDEQIRLTIEALREREEHEIVNDRDFGLLHNADYAQRFPTRHGPPTPDDFDELLSRRRKARVLIAHPLAIAAFGRECNRRGLYPEPTAIDGKTVHAWRGVPLLPCDKIPISAARTTSVLVMRTGEDDQGVVGLHHVGLADEVEPGLSVRFMGIDDRATISYLVSAYYAAAVLVPDALGILEDVEIGRSGRA